MLILQRSNPLVLRWAIFLAIIATLVISFVVWFNIFLENQQTQLLNDNDPAFLVNAFLHALGRNDFDFAKNYNFKPHTAASTEELLQIFQTHLDKAINDLSSMGDEDFNKIWTVRNGEQVSFQGPKKVAIRGWAFSHMIHHRGQLSVYLRLLDIPVPGMYGPSADEKM